MSEVVLGLEFQPIPGLGAVALAHLTDRWARDYPILLEQPPLPPGPPPGGLTEGPRVLMNVGAPAVRIWRLTEHQDKVLQVQRDRLILNWQRRDSSYPHFEQLRPRFESGLADLAEYVESEGLGSVYPGAAEITYVNRFVSQEGSVAALRVSMLAQQPRLSALGFPLAYQSTGSWRIPSDRGAAATLRVSSDSAQPETLGAVLTLTYREALAPNANSEAVMASLDAGHELIVRSFDELTTPTMHSLWEKRHDFD